MATIINTCQKVCAQLTNPGGTPNYIWFPTTSNVLVSYSGTGLNAVISGNIAGPATVNVFDSTDTLIAVFKFTVVDTFSYVPSVTSNTVYLASNTATASATSLGTKGTFSGNFSTFSTTGNGNNTVWFSFISASNGGFSGVTNVFWNRASSANQILVDHDAITTVTLSIIGIGVTSTNPAFNALDFQIPIVQYATGNQSSAFSSLISLPYNLSCGDLTKYGVFVQNTNTSPNTNPVVVANLQSGNLLKIGWRSAVTSFAVSYMVVGTGVVNPTATFLRYSSTVSATLTSPTGFVDVTLPQAFTIGATLWLATLGQSTISNTSAFIFKIVGAYQTTTTNLRIVYSSTNTGSSSTSIFIIGLANLNTAGITLAEN